MKILNLKNTKSVIAFVLLLASNNYFSQQNNQFTKDVMPVSPEKSEEMVRYRNPNATTIIIKGITIDKRAARHYSATDINNMEIEKAKKLNHIYVDSYVLLSTSTDAFCKEKIESNFDLGPYNIRRKQTERITIPVNFEGCQFEISLFSWDEINKFN